MGFVSPAIRETIWQEINWGRKKQCLSKQGSYCCVYRIEPGLVLKLGIIDEREARRQERAGKDRIALPVLAYEEHASLVPLRYVHETWANIEGYEQGEIPRHTRHCPCVQERYSGLLMPEAKALDRTRYTPEQISAFLQQVTRYCLHTLNFDWEAKVLNIAEYQGKLVALDFGAMDE